MDELLDPPEWVLLEEEALAGTEDARVELTADDILDHLRLAERHRANAEAARLALLARYRELRAREGELAERSVSDEVALALRISHTHAAHELGLAQDLTERLPDTFDALRAGRIDLAKARALAEVTRPLPVDKARMVEAKVLPKAEGRLLAQVRASARYHLGRVDPDGVELRRQQAKAERRAWFDLHDDGVGELCLSGPGERLYQAWILIDTLARRIRVAGDERTLEAIRHDLALDLILGKNNERIKVHVYLHLPAPTAMGVSNDPGILAGYGPVTAQAARELAVQDAVWKRIFYDPFTSVIKDVDRRTYRPPAALAEYVRVRDHTCVGPGCSTPAQHCQVDHTLAWADGGCTCADNLGPLCLRCHRLKHLCGWLLSQPHPGKFLWKSPVGQIHEHLPEPILDHQPIAA